MLKIVIVKIGLVITLWGLGYVLALGPALSLSKGQKSASASPSDVSHCFTVNRIVLLNNTILPKDEVEKILARNGDSTLCWEELQVLAEKLTQLYLDLGYITSAVIVPEQKVLEEVQLIAYEGKLESVEVSGLSRIQQSYVKSKLSKLVGKVLNAFEVELVLEQLLTDPLFDGVQGELKQGSTPGSSVLYVTFQEAPSFSIDFGFDNYQSPLVGELEAQVGFNLLNLSGYGDRYQSAFQWSEGADKLINSYFLPLNSYRGGVKLFYETSNSRVILSELEDAGIRFQSSSYGIGWIQPIRKSRREEFSLGITLEFRDSRSFILENEPFSLSEAAVDGVTKFRVIRILQDWVNQNGHEYFVLRTRLNFGLDSFDATLSEAFKTTPVYLFGQFQYGRRVQSRLVLVGRFGFGFSTSPLPPIEQFEIGGAYSVRGYARATKLGDNGIYLSGELQISLLQSDRFGSLELIPFVDFGRVWQSGNLPSLDSDGSLASIGIGFRYYFKEVLTVRLDYGIPLIEVDKVGKGISNQGFNFLIYLVPVRF